MQVSVESPTKVQRRVTVVVPPQRLEQAFEAQLTQFAKKADIKGFRPGKVPLTLIKQRFGQEVRSEALSVVIQETLNEAIRQEKLYPITTPQVETKPFGADNTLEYTATFDVLPEVGPIHFNVDRLEKMVAKIADSDVEGTIERLREQNVQWKKVEGASKEKDKISGKIQMFQEDGQPLTPESMPLEFVLKDQPSVFGWNLMEKLGGKKAGDAVQFSHVLPKEAFLQGMGGKTLQFKVEVLEVAEPELAEVDQDFVKKLGIASGEVTELRDEIRKQLELNLKRSIKGRLREQVFAKLLEQNPIELPQSLVEREAKHLHDEHCSMKGQGQHRHSPEDEANFLKIAKKRILLGLLIGELAKQHKMDPSEERVNEHLAEFASVYTDADEYIRRLKADQRGMREIETAVLEDQVVEKLLEKVALVEKDVGYDQIIKQDEENPES